MKTAGLVMRFAATLSLCGYLGSDLSVNVDAFDIGGKIIHRIEPNALATVQRIESFLRSLAQPFQLRPVFLFALLQQTQTITNNLAGIVDASRLDPGFNEFVDVFRKMDAARRHARPSVPSRVAANGNNCHYKGDCYLDDGVSSSPTRSSIKAIRS